MTADEVTTDDRLSPSRRTKISIVLRPSTEWWGASLVVTSSTRDGIGVGGLVRWNNYVLGVTRHKSDTPGESDNTFILLGVDLYDLFNKKRPDSEKFKEIRDTLPASLLSGK